MIARSNGNTLTIGAGGIVHSSGKSIVFHRDVAGRIESITDPNGNSMFYHYDPNGDLISYTDNENNTSTYTYDANHRLLTIHDPRNIQPIRNDYDADGRLISGWDYSLAQDALETAAGFWSSQTNINVKSRPIITLNGCDNGGNCILPPTLNNVPNAAWVRARLAEKGANAKHLTVFVGGIVQPGANYTIHGYTDSQNGISYISTEGWSATMFWFRWHPSGEIVAHEWGHTFIGPGHVSIPNLMHEPPGLLPFLPLFFNQETLTTGQRVAARQGAMRYPPG